MADDQDTGTQTKVVLEVEKNGRKDGWVGDENERADMRVEGRLVGQM